MSFLKLRRCRHEAYGFLHPSVEAFDKAKWKDNKPTHPGEACIHDPQLRGVEFCHQIGRSGQKSSTGVLEGNTAQPQSIWEYPEQGPRKLSSVI